MSSQRVAVLAVICGTLVLSGWAAGGLVGLGSPGVDSGGAPKAVGTPPVTATAKESLADVSVRDTEAILVALPDPSELPTVRIASENTSDPVHDDAEVTALPFEVPEMESFIAALPDPYANMPQDPPSVPLVSLFRPAPAEEKLRPAVRAVETPNECFVPDICIDEYLWSFYEWAPKVDTNKVREQVKATVTRKGKTRTVTKTITRYVVGDFTWKDPMAAQRVGMTVKDYVIGGMNRGFKLKLYRALRAMDNAGLMPGITSAFRDDYRQGIASGKKAASDSSFHGGSRRGGYGHGLAADLVSVKGETRLERVAATVELWNWIDAHEKELGIGRPYRNRDPPHVGPIDGPEYIVKRGGPNAKLAVSAAGKHQPGSTGSKTGVTKPATKSGSLKVGSI